MLALAAAPAAQEPQVSLNLEVRAFNGTEDVTAQYAPDGAPRRRTTDLGDSRSIRWETASRRCRFPAGIYDVQAIHERDGKVVNIRWANRLVVMPYPDEKGQHLEVINFKNGFGALQVRGAGPEERVSTASIYEAGKRDKPVATPHGGRSYALFVVPAGLYDLQVRIGDTVTWHDRPRSAARSHPTLDRPHDLT